MAANLELTPISPSPKTYWFHDNPPLRWDNPVEAEILHYIVEKRGEEMARIMTLP